MVVEIKVPTGLGDADSDYEIAEIPVKTGDRVSLGDPLVTLEADKASVEVPAPFAGIIKELKVELGQQVSEGDILLLLDEAEQASEVVEVADEAVEIKVPTGLGDADSDYEIAEIPVKTGDRVSLGDPLVTLEADKASVEVPAPFAGIIKELKVELGQQVSEGDILLLLDEVEQAGEAEEKLKVEPSISDESKGVPISVSKDSDDIHTDFIQTDLVVLGSGPGGYTAAFRAADLGLKTILVERYPSLGGVCLNVGCIPSKALLHAAKVISEVKEISEYGIDYGQPKIDTNKLREWKNKVSGQLTKGLSGLAKQREVKVISGIGKFLSSNQLAVTGPEKVTTIEFENAIIAAGSLPAKVPSFPDDPRIIDSTGALELEEIPERLLVIGGGIIGLEMATVYHELGSKITIVEMLDNLVNGADRDIVKPFHKHIEKQYENIYLGTRVTDIKVTDNDLIVSFDGPRAPKQESFDRILVAVGRQPNGNKIDADKAGVHVDQRGFIPVDKQQRTNVPHIYAIGDIVGQPMLAHKATHEGKVAAEVIAGLKSSFDAQVIPSVAYTDPEIAWVGITETEAKNKGIKYSKGIFPWAASGRSLSLGRDEGISKLLFDTETDRVIGAGIVGPNAGELIAEVALAIEMGCEASDIGSTIHPHPTLTETVAFSAEAFEGTITDIYIPQKK